MTEQLDPQDALPQFVDNRRKAIKLMLPGEDGPFGGDREPRNPQLSPNIGGVALAEPPARTDHQEG
jgi:hypothetical protein